MFAASREALHDTRQALNAALPAGDTAAAAQAGADLFAVVALLDQQRALRVALGDSSTTANSRTELASQLFDKQIGGPAATVVRTAAWSSWSSIADLVNSLELLGREALLRAAADQDQLGTVEDELFRLGRIVAGDAALEQALSNPAASADGKRALIAKLLYGKVTAITEALSQQAMARLRTAPADAFDALANLAAAQRNQIVAKVRSAANISDEQQQKLADSLARTYGRAVTVHVEVDPSLLGGAVVRVGDDVIDGSAAGRLAALRKTFHK